MADHEFETSIDLAVNARVALMESRAVVKLAETEMALANEHFTATTATASDIVFAELSENGTSIDKTNVLPAAAGLLKIAGVDDGQASQMAEILRPIAAGKGDTTIPVYVHGLKRDQRGASITLMGGAKSSLSMLQQVDRRIQDGPTLKTIPSSTGQRFIANSGYYDWRSDCREAEQNDSTFLYDNTIISRPEEVRAAATNSKGVIIVGFAAVSAMLRLHGTDSSATMNNLLYAVQSGVKPDVEQAETSKRVTDYVKGILTADDVCNAAMPVGAHPLFRGQLTPDELKRSVINGASNTDPIYSFTWMNTLDPVYISHEHIAGMLMDRARAAMEKSGASYLSLASSEEVIKALSFSLHNVLTVKHSRSQSGTRKEKKVRRKNIEEIGALLTAQVGSWSDISQESSMVK